MSRDWLRYAHQGSRHPEMGGGMFWSMNEVVAQELFATSCSGILTRLGWLYVCGTLSSMPDLLWWSEELGLPFPVV